MAASSATYMLPQNVLLTAANAGDRAAERLCPANPLTRLTRSRSETQPRQGPLSRSAGVFGQL